MTALMASGEGSVFSFLRDLRGEEAGHITLLQCLSYNKAHKKLTYVRRRPLARIGLVNLSTALISAERTI